MNGFLQTLVDRSLTSPGAVRPRLPNRFETPLERTTLPASFLDQIEEPAGEEGEDRLEPPSEAQIARPIPARPAHPSPPAPIAASFEASPLPPPAVAPSSPLAGLQPPQENVRPLSPPLPTTIPAQPARDQASPLPTAPAHRDQEGKEREPAIQARPLAQPNAPDVTGPPAQPEIPPPAIRPAAAQRPARSVASEPLTQRRGPEISAEQAADRPIMADRSPAPLVQPPLAAAQPRIENRIPPTIQVTIGRIDVRAQFSASPATPPLPPTKPLLSLDDYLKDRDGGGT